MGPPATHGVVEYFVLLYTVKSRSHSNLRPEFVLLYVAKIHEPIRDLCEAITPEAIQVT